MLTNKKFSIIIFFTFIITFFLVSIPSFFVYKILLKAKEDLSLQETTKFQLEKNAIYNYLNLDMFQYKLELIKNIKPKIVAIGSSRVMQFREESFNTSFITTGGAANYLNEGLLFLKEMTKHHKPEIIILGLDFWWFNEKFYQPKIFDQQEKKEIDIKSKINQTLSMVIKGEIGFDIFEYILKDTNDITSYKNIGLRSLKYSNGFRKDGSYQYTR